MDRFANCLSRELQAHGIQAKLLSPAIRAGGKFRTKEFRKWGGYIDKFALFPRELERRLSNQKPEVVHVIDQAGAIYMNQLSRVRHLLTVNDMIAIRSALGEIPEHQTRQTGKILQATILKGIKRAKKISCISNATLSDLIRIAEVPSALAKVIPMGLNAHFAPMEKQTARSIITRISPEIARGDFILHVGGNQWYKNRAGAVRIFRELIRISDSYKRVKLVLAGAPLSVEMEKEINKEPEVRKAIILASNCSHEELRALYSAATALLFPSLYEGFGWPIIEAQACGCQVFTSNRTPMTEVGGDGAEYINPAIPAEAAARVAKVIADRGHVERLLAAGFSNARRYSAERMVSNYISLYGELSTEDGSERMKDIVAA